MVKVDEDAQAVGVVKTMEEVEGCRKIGDVGSRTTARVGLIARGDTTVALELERLARNEAAQHGGNTIVPLGPVTAEGTRRYGNYDCPSD
jgi:hypothetical protein